MSETKTEKGKAYWLYIAFLFTQYARPQEQFFPFLAPLRIPGLIGALVPLVWLFACKKDALRESVIRYAILILVPMAIMVPFARNNFWAYQKTEQMLFIFLQGMLPAAALLARSDRMLHFLRAWVIIQFILAVACLKNGGTGTGSFLKDENDLALALCMALPYPFFLRKSARTGFKLRMFYVAASLTMILGVATTGSRGGFLGLIAAFGTMWWWSKNRVKNAVLIAFLATAGSGVLVASAPEGYFQEMSTISDPEDGTRQERLKSWGLGWDMFLDYPIFGVGGGNFPWNASVYQLRRSLYPEREKILGGREAHSMYFTLIPELGLTGIILFLAVVLGLNSRLSRVVRRVEKSAVDSDRAEELALAAKAMRCSLVTFLINGVFISVLYYPHLWYLIGFVVGLERALDSIYSERRATLREPEIIEANDDRAPALA